MNQEILKELISDHANHPRNHYKLGITSCQCHGKNPLCGDEVTLRILLSDDKSMMEKIAFEGRGCPISQASASLLTEVCSGLSVEDAKALTQYLRSIIIGNPTASSTVEGRWYSKLGGIMGVSDYFLLLETIEVRTITVQ